MNESQEREETNIRALYRVQFAYTAEAWATLAKNPQDRSEPVRELAPTGSLRSLEKITVRTVRGSGVQPGAACADGEPVQHPLRGHAVVTSSEM